MTYRELLDLFLQSRSSTIVRFNEGGENLPPAGMVARLTGIWTAGKGETATIASLRFSFSEFASNNVNFDVYDPAPESQPWQVKHLSADGTLEIVIAEEEAAAGSFLLDGEIRWFDVLESNEIRESSEDERIGAKEHNIQKVDTIRKNMVKAIWNELDVTDPNCVKYRSLASKIDEAIQNCIDRLI